MKFRLRAYSAHSVRLTGWGTPAQKKNTRLSVFFTKRSGSLRIEAIASDTPSAKVAEVLDLVGLADAADRRVGGFSLGMRQRLGLATALLGDPQILILDEPANGLDPEGVRWLRRLLRDFASEGRTVLVSSHILAEVRQTVDSVVIMNAGRLVTHTSLAELFGATTEDEDLEDIFLRLTAEEAR